ncbi:hypothetical protein BJ878DRAFT_495506, partial [Calycina marina]
MNTPPSGWRCTIQVILALPEQDPAHNRQKSQSGLREGSIRDIPPTPLSDTVQGVLENRVISPNTIGAVSYTEAPSANSEPKLATVHFHRGAFVLVGARTNESRWGPVVF